VDGSEQGIRFASQHRERAQALGKKISAEDGVSEALRVIDSVVGNPRIPSQRNIV